MATQGYQYVPAKTRHGLHFLLSVFTFGLWLPVWIGMTIYNHNRSVLKQLPPAPVQAHAYMPAQYPGYPYPYSVAQPPGYPPRPLEVSDGSRGQQHQVPARLPSPEA